MIGARLLPLLLAGFAIGGCAGHILHPAEDMQQELVNFVGVVSDNKDGPPRSCLGNDPRRALDDLVYASKTTAELSEGLRQRRFDEFWATDPIVIAALVARATAHHLLQGMPPPPLFGHAEADIKVFHDHLKAMLADVEAGFWQNLANEPDNQVSFLGLLLAYEREYFSNGFVTHFGVKLAAPDLGDAKIPDSTIADAATVFFEALFDFLEGLDGGVLLFTNKAWTPGAGDPPKDLKWWGSNAAALPTAAAPIKLSLDGKTRLYNPYLRIIPTIVPAPTACGMTASAAVATTTLASWFGRRLVVWNGVLLENFSSINIGFVVAGTSIAVGDNKTLVTLAKAAIGTIGRRAAEHALVDFFLSAPPSKIDRLLRFFPPAASGGS